MALRLQGVFDFGTDFHLQLAQVAGNQGIDALLQLLLQQFFWWPRRGVRHRCVHCRHCRLDRWGGQWFWPALRPHGPRHRLKDRLHRLGQGWHKAGGLLLRVVAHAAR